MKGDKAREARTQAKPPRHRPSMPRPYRRMQSAGVWVKCVLIRPAQNTGQRGPACHAALCRQYLKSRGLCWRRARTGLAVPLIPPRKTPGASAGTERHRARKVPSLVWRAKFTSQGFWNRGPQSSFCFRPRSQLSLRTLVGARPAACRKSWENLDERRLGAMP